MTFVRSKTANRVVVLLSAGMLSACISLATSLPGQVSKTTGDTIDIAPASLLPGMMDASASFTTTGETATTVSIGRETPIEPALPAAPVVSGPVTSGEISTTVALDGADGPDHKGCVPEPVSLLLMTSGLLGLAGARRFRRPA